MNPKTSRAIFNTSRYLKRRGIALQKSAATTNTPFFLREFAIDGNIETINLLKPDFENGLELFSNNGDFVKKLAEHNLLGAHKKIGHMTIFEPASEEYDDDIECINYIKTIPFGDEKFDIIIANEGINWVNDLPGFLARIKNTLKPNGTFIASFLGGKTLNELRQTMLNVESNETGGAAMRINPMVDLEGAVNLLRRAGFTSPVSSSEVLKVRYSNIFSLFRDIKAMGENAAFNSNNIPLSRKLVNKIADYYHQNYSDDDGRIYASFEIVNISGWK